MGGRFTHWCQLVLGIAWHQCVKQQGGIQQWTNISLHCCTYELILSLVIRPEEGLRTRLKLFWTIKRVGTATSLYMAKITLHTKVWMLLHNNVTNVALIKAGMTVMWALPHRKNKVALVNTKQRWITLFSEHWRSFPVHLTVHQGCQNVT